MTTELKPCRTCHCAVSSDNFVIIIGGITVGRAVELSSTHIIWVYNLYTEEWRNHIIPDTSCAPEPFHGAVAAAIGKTIYTFGGLNKKTSTVTNALWTLSRTKEGCFIWSSNKQQCKKKSPSPRFGHTGWEYGGKLWIFAGCGHSTEGYLNDHGYNEGFRNGAMNNQLLCYDPNTHNWTNPQCFGSIPTPRSNHASTIFNDKVWVLGGKDSSNNKLGDFFELRMNSLTWSQIQTVKPRPKARSSSTLTALTNDMLVLHGGFGVDETMTPVTLHDTWIIDLTSHSWKQFTSRKDHARAWHTGSAGLNNNVIIIGGYKKCKITYTCKVHNDIINVILGPKSLQHVAMQVILKHRNELPLNGLPRKLLSLLQMFVKEDQDVHSRSETLQS